MPDSARQERVSQGRHPRQLAQNQQMLEGLERTENDSDPGTGTQPVSGATEMIHRIQTATRPTISLDATFVIPRTAHFDAA